jgi:hypothetical protein
LIVRQKRESDQLEERIIRVFGADSRANQGFTEITANLGELVKTFCPFPA